MTTSRKLTMALSYLRSAYNDIRPFSSFHSHRIRLAIDEINLLRSGLSGSLGKSYNIRLK